mgnify:CR=1 FL=1
MKKKAIIVSGYFNPIHKGHLEYFNKAKENSDKLFVIVNSDLQRELKRSKAFQDEEERMIIVSNIKAVDKAILSVDKDRTVCKSLEAVRPNIFANGGDRVTSEVPETPICKKYNIKMVDGLGDKIRSSSNLTGLKEIK